MITMAKLREISRKFMLKTRGGREAFVPYLERQIKAIITSEEDNRLKQVNGNQEEKAVAEDDGGKDDSSFEFRVVGVALEANSRSLSDRTIGLATAVCQASGGIIKSQEIGREIVHLHNLKSEITSLTTKAQEVRGKLEQLLDDGNDDDLPILLKSYFMQLNGTLTNLTKLRRYIGKLEDHLFSQIEMRLNHLIRRLMCLIAGAVYFTIYMFVAHTYYPSIWNKELTFQLDGDILTGIFVFSLGFWFCCCYL